MRMNAKRGALLAFESPRDVAFDGPALEWRRLFSEILGTLCSGARRFSAYVVEAVLGVRSAAQPPSQHLDSRSLRSLSVWVGYPGHT